MIELNDHLHFQTSIAASPPAELINLRGSGPGSGLSSTDGSWSKREEERVRLPDREGEHVARVQNRIQTALRTSSGVQGIGMCLTKEAFCCIHHVVYPILPQTKSAQEADF